jgi:Arc/MetJ-type ribon-helix-helix transcriptional regulator
MRYVSMKRTTVSLPEHLVQRLEREARRRDTSASAVVREALDEHLGSSTDGKREIPFAGLGASGHTDTGQRAAETLRETGFGTDPGDR